MNDTEKKTSSEAVENQRQKENTKSKRHGQWQLSMSIRVNLIRKIAKKKGNIEEREKSQGEIIIKWKSGLGEKGILRWVLHLEKKGKRK